MTVNVTLDTMDKVHNIAVRAGRAIMEVYGTDFDVETKADDSPVTQADRRAETLITNAIRGELSDAFLIVGEEAVGDGAVIDVGNKPFWLVDPLDGTKEFVKRNGEFTVNIALIDAGLPVLGVVHAPAISETFLGSHYGAFKVIGDGEPQAIHCRKVPLDGMVALVSRSHKTPEVDEYLAQFKIKDEISAGSSLKFCRIAEGAADIYPRFGRTFEWDTAAGHAVVRFAGGRVTRLDGQGLVYAKPGLVNPHFLVQGSS